MCVCVNLHMCERYVSGCVCMCMAGSICMTVSMSEWVYVCM